LDEEIKNSIFIFEEGSTGLDESDMGILMECFDDLIDEKNSVILIEDNLWIMCEGDWMMDVGRGGGLDGGKVEFSGRGKKLIDS
ncbi:P-loop NTPase family protein, partial [Staphylococcus epidermidis]